nr:HNH endonuclease signature motif containing protein [Streptomyces sp. C1-2]
MQDLTVAAPPPPIPLTGRTVHVKGEPIEFSPDQIVRLFWVKANRATRTGCWEWTGKTLPNGYGQITIAKRHIYSHRVSYEIHKGQIPDGLHIDHLCRNRACCNPAHLEAVTCRENVRRSPIALAAINAAKTHCARGHEFTEANTVIIASGRNCRTCRRWHERRVAAKKRGLPLPTSPDQVVPRVRRDSCPNGHPYDAANTYVDPKGNRRCRSCAREDSARYKAKRAAGSQR